MLSRSLLIGALCLAAPLLCRAENVALTFDDLPLNGELPPGVTEQRTVKSTLAVLKKHHVPQVYGFVNAIRFEDNRDGAEALKLWVAGGERVGNHTYSHMDLNKSAPEAFLADMRQNEPVLQLLDKSDNWRWLRYPYLREGDDLEKRHAVRAGLQSRGYRIAQVTLDYEDYLWNTPYARCFAQKDEKAIQSLRASYLAVAASHLDADREMARMVFGREISHVLLLHLGAFSSTILPDLLELLQQKGFTLVTLEEAQRDPAYDTDPDVASSRAGGSLLEQWMDARKLAYPPAMKKPYQELEAMCRPGSAAG